MKYDDYIAEHGTTELDPDQVEKNRAIIEHQKTREQMLADDEQRALTLMSELEKSIKEGKTPVIEMLTTCLELTGALAHNPDWAARNQLELVKRYDSTDDPDHILETAHLQELSAMNYVNLMKKRLMKYDKELHNLQRDLQQTVRELSRLTPQEELEQTELDPSSAGPDS